MPSRRRALAALLLAVAATALAACSAGSGLSDLDRDAQERDQLPAGFSFPELEQSEIITDSARMVGTHEGGQVWLARTTDGLCIGLYADGASDRWACSGGTPMTMGMPGAHYTVVADADVPPEGATAISENVFVR